ncbi:protein of unknown function (plasmid) [Cupriavidus taiwanensis]|uniref:Uncharacterized protein n=1 Tax=Cupriavidus taiwanensis TaxID=164546 RepID=A0A9Q7XVD8_9BURK|nr:protein of unknown function [Cupriavidus taiwanensis]
MIGQQSPAVATSHGHLRSNRPDPRLSSAPAEVRCVQPSVGAAGAAIVLFLNQKNRPCTNETHPAVAFRPAMAGGRHPDPGIDACRLRRR